MEIPVINRISNFETGINSLHNPSFVSQLFTLSGIEKIYQAYNFWKWGALILALVASFTTIINRIIKILIIKLKHHKSLCYQPLINNLDDYEDDSEEETSCSSSSDEEEEEEEDDDDDDVSTRSSSSWRQVDEDFQVKGSGSGHYLDDQQLQNRNLTFRRRRRGSFTDMFSWSEFANGKSVVKLWDNLGLGFGLGLNNSSSENVIAVYDMNKEQNIMSIFGGKREIPAFSTSSSNAVIVSAVKKESGGVSLRGWDTRVGGGACQIPAIFAEWRPKKVLVGGNKIINVEVNAGGDQKLYVRDDVTGDLTVGDLRNVSSPLENLTESDVDTWWDADDACCYCNGRLC